MLSERGAGGGGGRGPGAGGGGSPRWSVCASLSELCRGTDKTETENRAPPGLFLLCWRCCRGGHVESFACQPGSICVRRAVKDMPGKCFNLPTLIPNARALNQASQSKYSKRFFGSAPECGFAVLCRPLK